MFMKHTQHIHSIRCCMPPYSMAMDETCRLTAWKSSSSSEMISSSPAGLLWSPQPSCACLSPLSSHSSGLSSPTTLSALHPKLAGMHSCLPSSLCKGAHFNVRYALLGCTNSLQRSSTGCDIRTPCCAGTKQVKIQMAQALL